MSGRQAYLDLLGKKPRASEEEQLQRSIIDLLRVAAHPDVIWFHCPNGMARSKSEGGRLKAMGVLPGVYDLIFLVPRRFDYGDDIPDVPNYITIAVPCFLELKRVRGIASAEQLAFGERCDRIGVEHAITADFDQALSILKAWGVLSAEVTA